MVNRGANPLAAYAKPCVLRRNVPFFSVLRHIRAGDNGGFAFRKLLLFIPSGLGATFSRQVLPGFGTSAVFICQKTDVCIASGHLYIYISFPPFAHTPVCPECRHQQSERLAQLHLRC